MILKRSKLVCLLSVLSFLIVKSYGRKGTFESKHVAPIPLLPGVPLLSQRISIDDELIKSVISPAFFCLPFALGNLHILMTTCLLTVTRIHQCRYRPQGLLPSKGYEVRISAPATVSSKSSLERSKLPSIP